MIRIVSRHEFAVSGRPRDGPVSYTVRVLLAFLDLQAADFVTIGILVVLEGLLSADNALVMAIMVLGLPRDLQQKALRYGLVGGFAFRIIATLLAAYLMEVAWIKLAGGAYLAYLIRMAGRPAARSSI